MRVATRLMRKYTLSKLFQKTTRWKRALKSYIVSSVSQLLGDTGPVSKVSELEAKWLLVSLGWEDIRQAISCSCVKYPPLSVKNYKNLGGTLSRVLFQQRYVNRHRRGGVVGTDGGS